ncbi:hypothetical protein phiK7A1_054 [Pseudomonas phage phiK7A1]|uniref:HNH endonuclease n=1 Tax=Pseudomonas phage phiK7A1 TaxID=2759194 RepID=A0A7H0XFQ4_9CAUD|nr:hypothetical protein phiK7A1_054 [Pseudomonas phage phiK7A1]
MKACTQCSQVKPLGDYYFKGRKADNILMSECKVCFNNRNMDRYEEKARWLVEQKGGGCTLCGYSECTAALEFHHKDPSQKDFQINKRWSMTKEAILLEIEKCVLLCANCHRETHWKIARGETVEFIGR